MLNPMEQFDGTITTSGNCIVPYVPYVEPAANYPIWIQSVPRECSGDVHVFPCPHCDKCKCGKATVKRDRKGGK